jgi:hypothetical protein
MTGAWRAQSSEASQAAANGALRGGIRADNSSPADGVAGCGADGAVEGSTTLRLLRRLAAAARRSSADCKRQVAQYQCRLETVGAAQLRHRRIAGWRPERMRHRRESVADTVARSYRHLEPLQSLSEWSQGPRELGERRQPRPKTDSGGIRAGVAGRLATRRKSTPTPPCTCADRRDFLRVTSSGHLRSGAFAFTDPPHPE